MAGAKSVCRGEREQTLILLTTNRPTNLFVACVQLTGMGESVRSNERTNDQKPITSLVGLDDALSE